MPLTAPRTTFQLSTALHIVQHLAQQLHTIDPSSAQELLRQLTAIERLTATTSARLAHMIGDQGARRGAGYRDAASLLSRLSGSSVAKARTSIDTIERLRAVPSLAHAVSHGTLSLDQARVIGPAAAAAPQRAPELLQAAQHLALRDLKQEAQRFERRSHADASLVARERQLFARRYCRAWALEGGGIRLHALLPSLDGARVIAALNVETTKLFKASSSSTAADSTALASTAAGSTAACSTAACSTEQLRADALVRLLTSGGGRVSTQVLVRVDARALRAGGVGDHEVCEIDGVGPISVAQARSLLPDAFLTLLVRDGRDITTVTSTTRCVPRRVRVALAERDQTCVVPGCGAAHGLEIDHWRLDFARFGPTELDNLCRLCSVHHRLKTRTGWRLLGGPGQWAWRPPRWTNVSSRT